MNHRGVVHAEVSQHVVDDDPLFLPRRVARVDHMQQHVGLAHFLERRAETRHKMVRQFPDEPHGIGEQHLLLLAKHDVAREGVERRK